MTLHCPRLEIVSRFRKKEESFDLFKFPSFFSSLPRFESFSHVSKWANSRMGRGEAKWAKMKRKDEGEIEKESGIWPQIKAENCFFVFSEFLGREGWLKEINWPNSTRFNSMYGKSGETSETVGIFGLCQRPPKLSWFRWFAVNPLVI